jgi:hypothetical protein
VPVMNTTMSTRLKRDVPVLNCFQPRLLQVLLCHIRRARVAAVDERWKMDGGYTHT